LSERTVVPATERRSGSHGEAADGAVTAGQQGHGRGGEQAGQPADGRGGEEAVGGLVDQVGGQQYGPGMLGVVGEQPVVEQLAGRLASATSGST
jgi:hypothetical protein